MTSRSQAIVPAAALPDNSTMRPGPLFVVGMWRSGTSLLYALLNQHPQISLMYEGELPLLHSLFVFPRRSASWLQKWDAWNGALTRHRVDHSQIDANISNLADAERAVCEQIARRKGATIWGCKSPSYFDCMEDLSRWFPEAKFIVIWRDPADVCRSIINAARKSAWFARPGMDLRAVLGYFSMKQQADKLVQTGAAIHQLQYNDLVRDPQGTVLEICEFLRIPFAPRMSTLEGVDSSAIYGGEHHTNVKSADIKKVEKNRPEVLSPELKRKIQRYVAHWRKQTGGAWPVYADPGAGELPSRWELASDQVKYQLLRRYDLTIPYLYAFLPLPLWQRYRSLKQRRLNAKVGSPPARAA